MSYINFVCSNFISNHSFEAMFVESRNIVLKIDLVLQSCQSGRVLRKVSGRIRAKIRSLLI